MTKLLGWLALAAMFVVLTLTLAVGTHVASVSTDSEKSGNLQIEKNCSVNTGQARSYCTIGSSLKENIDASM
jgi:hypothetical protein